VGWFFLGGIQEIVDNGQAVIVVDVPVELNDPFIGFLVKIKILITAGVIEDVIPLGILAYDHLPEEVVNQFEVGCKNP